MSPDNIYFQFFLLICKSDPFVDESPFFSSVVNVNLNAIIIIIIIIIYDTRAVKVSIIIAKFSPEAF